MTVPQGLRSFIDRREPATIRVLAALSLVSTALAAFLIRADKPWNQKLLARWHSPKGPKLDDFITAGLWYGAALALAFLLISLLSQRWWSLPAAPVRPDHGRPVLPPAARRWVWLMLAAVTILAMWARSPRLSHSFWNDEAMHLRYYVWGDPSAGSPDQPHFEAATWKDALFLNKKGNNHIGSSLEARASHALSGGSWDGSKPFVESHLRLFPWLSGLLTVALTGFIGAALGNPRTGLAAGLIIAIHPWHQRWSVEMRGYSTMILATTAAVWCLLRALQSNRWRWWLGFAAAQAVTLLWFAGAVYPVAAANISALAVIISSRRASSQERLNSALRLVTAGALSLVPVALIMGPSVPQIAAYLKRSHHYAPMDLHWYMDLGSHLLSGLRSHADPPSTSGGLTLPNLTAASLWQRALFLFILPLLSISGLLLFIRENWKTRLITGTLLGGAALGCLHNSLSHSAMMNWYLLYLIPLFALSLAWSGRFLASLFPDSHRAQAAPLLIAALFALASAPAIARQQQIPRQPIREAVALARGSAPALQPNPDVVTATFGTGAGQIRIYDPAVHLLADTAALTNLTNECRDAGKPLWIYLFNRHAITSISSPTDPDSAPWPDMLAFLEDSGEFQYVGLVPGMEAIWSCSVFCSVPDTIIRLKSPPPQKP